jgi:hypothetical protein
LTNTNLPTNFESSLIYDANNVFLNLTLGLLDFGTDLNANQRNVANALINSFNTAGGIPLVFGTLSPAGLTRISGETATGTQQTTFDAMNMFMGLMTDPNLAGRGGPAAPASGVTGYAEESSRSRFGDAFAAISRRRRCRQLFARAGASGGRLRRSQTTGASRARPNDTTSSTSAPPARTTVSRPTRSPASPWPEAAPISAWPIAAADVPTCSSSAHLSATPRAPPSSPPRSPMAGRTSRPTAPSTSQAPTSSAPASMPMRFRVGSRAAIASACRESA